VESVLALNNTSIVSAAGTEVSILNLAAGKVEHVIRSHQKSVTALSTAQNNTRLLTGALDGHLKVHNTTSWEVVAGFKYPSPILSLSVISNLSSSSREDRHLAVGLENGLLSIRTRIAGTEKAKTREKEKKMQALLAGEADEYERKQKKKDMRQGVLARDRGKDFRGEGADIIITGNDRSRQSMKKLRPWQKSLREGKYREALDLVLEPEGGGAMFNNGDVLTLITALRHRSALRTALSNRSSERLVPILRWCHKRVSYPRHITMVHDVLLLILDLYANKMAEWDMNEDGENEGKDVMKLIKRIERQVRIGVDLAQKAGGLQGMIACLEAG
jgi:U3 small nucleolar RNA-associated protein 15